MIVHIGEDVDSLNRMALTGKVDTNEICFNLKWVEFSKLKRKEV